MRTLSSIRLILLMLLLSTSAACPRSRGPASAPVENRAEQEALAPPILALIGQRDLLSLTSDQVVALDSIYQVWSVEDARLTRSGVVISTGMLGTSVARGAAAPSGPEARANHHRAARGVAEVLTPEQRRAVCDLHRAGREPVHRLWPWCSS